MRKDVLKHNMIFLQPTLQIGVAIGDQILKLKEVAHLFNGPELKNQQNALKQVKKLC